MADIALTAQTTTGIDGIAAQFATQSGDHILGENVAYGAPLCVSSTDGKVYNFNSAAAAAGTRAILAGVSPRKGKTGQPITVLGIGLRYHVSDAAALLKGAVYFASATPGAYADAATLVDAQGAFYAVSKSDLQVIRLGKLA